MLRDKNLVTLSHQHQHALALCVEIERALRSGGAPLAPLQQGIQQAFETEIDIHFQAEEQILFPVADHYEDLHLLVSELLAEHTMLRAYSYAAMAFSLTRSDLLEFAASLSDHIRKEERELFEGMQRLLTTPELAAIGAALENAFSSSAAASHKPKRNSAQSST